MKKLAMISQPMAGRSTWEIDETRNRAIAELEQRGYYVVNTFFTGAWHGKEKLEGQGVVQISLHFLAKSLEKMSFCHAVYFCRGWQDARGCRIEHDVAVAYGLEVIEE